MEDLERYISAIREYIFNNYKNNLKSPTNILSYPYIVPGSKYSHQLWDWDSWLTGLAILDLPDPKIEKYEKGCVLNFLNLIDEEGRIPILIEDAPGWKCNITNKYKSNIHKPCLAIHAFEISKKYGSAEWLRDEFDKFLAFASYYENNQYDNESGLYFWIDDLAMGFDNDPTAFYRPNNSSATIFLNCLMYEELSSISALADMLNLSEVASEYLCKAKKLKESIRNECFDKVDGFYYSADVSLRKLDINEQKHSGHPRFWHTLPIKITTWAGMLPLWCGIASEEEAKKVVNRYLNPNGLFSEYGIRTVAKNERMFGNFDTGNPSCWIGPIWINANYFTAMALKNYGYDELAIDIATKTIKILGRDIIEYGEFHEYYDSESGIGIRNKGFQSWNFLVLKLIDLIKN